jgi:hypothetical protein
MFSKIDKLVRCTMTDLNENKEAFLGMFMNCFTFRLAKGIELSNENNNYKIISTSPMRIIRLNKALYEIIKYLITGHKMYELIKSQSPLQIKSISSTLGMWTLPIITGVLGAAFLIATFFAYWVLKPIKT